MQHATTIRLSAVTVSEESERLVLSVLRSGHIAQGPMVARLEAGFAELCGTRHVVAVTNGTIAARRRIAGTGVGPGDEVVTSPFTFVATLNAILECGATARFADIDPATFVVDADQVAEAITPRTRVLMPVHLYGQAPDMTPPRCARVGSRSGDRRRCRAGPRRARRRRAGWFVRHGLLFPGTRRRTSRAAKAAC